MKLPPHTLHRHGSCIGPTVDTLSVSMSATDRGERLELRIDGGLDCLSLPGGLVPFHRLYQHTCLELFLARGDASYVEWNFSPTGQATRYEFSAYRERRSSAFNVPVAVSCVSKSASVHVVAEGRLLFEEVTAASITAVIRRPDGACSYWALAHPRTVPDFHDAGGFVLDGATLSPMGGA